MADKAMSHALRDKAITATMLTVLAALLLVGLPSGTILRHAVRFLPVAAAAAVIVGPPSWGRFAAMPVFAFWFLIMLLIWLYLLGLANVITGQFTPTGIDLAVVSRD